MLQTSFDVAKQYGHVYMVSALGGLTAVILGAWVLLTLVAVNTKYAPTEADKFHCRTGKGDVNCSSGNVIGLAIFVTFSGYWISEVIKNVIHVSISGGKFIEYIIFVFVIGGSFLTIPDFSLRIMVLLLPFSAGHAISPYTGCLQASNHIFLWINFLWILDRIGYPTPPPALLNWPEKYWGGRLFIHLRGFLLH